MRLTFGEFVFDSVRHALERSGNSVRLSPKAFKLLACLIEAAPAAVSRDTLYQKLWGDVFVVDANLPNLISEVRTALGDSHKEPKYIRTLHRHGYAFIGETAASPATPSRFAVEWGSRSFELRQGPNLLGRDESANVRIDSAGVSRTHASIVIRGNEAMLEDRGSKNGTFVGDERVDAARALSAGDVIRLGSVRVTFRVRATVESTMTEAAIPASGSGAATRGRSSSGSGARNLRNS